MLKLPKPFRKQGQQLCSDGNTAVFFDAYNVDHMHDAYQQGLAEQPERAPLSDAQVTVLLDSYYASDFGPDELIRKVEQLHGIKQGGQQAQPERAPLSDAELEQEFCKITGLETGINPAAADTKRALVWFKKGYAHAIKQGGQP